MIDQQGGDPTRRRPGPPSDAIMGLADALVRRLGPGGNADTVGSDVAEEAAPGGIPQRLGRFDIEGRLGSGAMGVVYAAHDPMLRRDIAIKVLAPNRTSLGAMERARREAQAMAQLSHPNVVKVFAIGEHEGALYIAMERIRGETLREWQSAGRAPDEVLAVYRQAARGLAELHASGLVHRDFKPANAMIGEDGRVRVLDLGLVAELVPSSSSEEESRGSGGSLGSGSGTRSDAILGTPAYMSPEQFLGEPVTAASDQFSFCVALHEALYGHRPFKAKTMTQLVEAICEERIESPKADSPVPRRIFKALRRGLSRDPSCRHASMDALLEALGGGSRTAAWIGGVGLLALATAGLAGAASDREESCPTSIRLDQAWSPERQARLSDALGENRHAAGGMGYYASELEKSVNGACEAEASASLACHDKQIASFDAAVGLMLEAPEGLQHDAMIEGLSKPSYCDGAASRPGTDSEMIALAGLVQRVDSLALSGLFDEALEEAHELVRRAQALGRPSLSLSAFYQRAKVYARRGDLEPAHADFTAAYELAVMTRSYGMSAQMALSLVWVTQNQDDLDGAEHWLRVASSAQEAQGGAGAGRQARILMRSGEVALARTDMEAARRFLTESAELWRGLGNAREEATVLASLVSVETEAGEFDAALAAARRAIEVFAAENGDGAPQLGTHYQNLGHVFRRTGQPEDALQAYEQALRRRKTSYGDEHLSTGEARIAKGSALLELGRADEAKVLFERVRRDAPPGHLVVSGAEMMLSRVASSGGDHELALALANKAFVSYETQLGAGHVWSAEVRVQLARAKLAAGDLAGALGDARVARGVFEDHFGSTHDRAGHCLAIEAEALAKQGTPDRARPLYEGALRIAVAAEGDSSKRVAALRGALAALAGGS